MYLRQEMAPTCSSDSEKTGRLGATMHVKLAWRESYLNGKCLIMGLSLPYAYAYALLQYSVAGYFLTFRLLQ